jgi:hypothetical protein
MDVVRRWREVFASDDAERLTVDDPPRYEGPATAMRAHHAGARRAGAPREFVVHEEREGLAIRQGAEAIGDADHAVAVLGRVAGRQDRGELDTCR